MDKIHDGKITVKKKIASAKYVLASFTEIVYHICVKIKSFSSLRQDY